MMSAGKATGGEYERSPWALVEPAAATPVIRLGGTERCLDSEVRAGRRVRRRVTFRGSSLERIAKVAAAAEVKVARYRER